MAGIFSSILATLITVPILGYLIIFVISKQITKQHKKSVHIALDVSTLLFVFSVHYLIVTIWGKSFMWLILLLMIAIAIIFAFIHWKVKDELHFTSVFRGFWRFNFLIFSSAYLVLVIIGLYQSITNSLS
ncbi:DUF3397 domain-containing protein [Cytobacillus sp. FJAT-54145]|uniref:DUF3397 domain-containing protein n=1 Tax=Cytobacillus spartinae TaxID=3299023 RepID=A0ABW6KHG6_9BACI